MSVALDPQAHGLLGWCAAEGFNFARAVSSVPLACSEVTRAAQSLPVVFHKQDDRWQAVAVLGPVQGANVFVSLEGKWRSYYVPAILRVYPFKLTKAGDLALWSDFQPEPLASGGVEPFFEKGELTPRLKQTLKFLQAVHSGVGAAHQVLQRLNSAAVLLPWQVPGVENRKADYELTDLFAIDEMRLGAQPDEFFLELNRGGSLRWLHAHLDSLHHAERFKALAKAIVAPEIAVPRQPEKIEQAADILAAIAEDLGDAEL